MLVVGSFDAASSAPVLWVILPLNWDFRQRCWWIFVDIAPALFSHVNLKRSNEWYHIVDLCSGFHLYLGLSWDGNRIALWLNIPESLRSWYYSILVFGDSRMWNGSQSDGCEGQDFQSHKWRHICLVSVCVYIPSAESTLARNFDRPHFSWQWLLHTGSVPSSC